MFSVFEQMFSPFWRRCSGGVVEIRSCSNICSIRWSEIFYVCPIEHFGKDCFFVEKSCLLPVSCLNKSFTCIFCVEKKFEGKTFGSVKKLAKFIFQTLSEKFQVGRRLISVSFVETTIREKFSRNSSCSENIVVFSFRD